MEGPRWLSGPPKGQVQMPDTINDLALLAVSSELSRPVVLKPPCLSTLVNCKPFRKRAVKVWKAV